MSTNHSTTTRHIRSSSHTNHRPYRYRSPLYKLDQLTLHYIPKKVEKNNQLKYLHETGQCPRFIQPPSFRQFYINRVTPIDILNDLIDYATYIHRYAIDTEDQINKAPAPSDPALIQIQYVHATDPPIILLIEMFHLPPAHSQHFQQIQRLCQTILSSNSTFISWGDGRHELEKFCCYNLFNHDDLDRVTFLNLQDAFKLWLDFKSPMSPHRKLNPNDKYSLQTAIYITFHEWLDKRMTLANWGCGIDPSLHTHLSHDTTAEAHQMIEDELQFREFMLIYAMNDCFAVSKLCRLMELFLHDQALLKNDSVGFLDAVPSVVTSDSTILNNDRGTIHVLNEPSIVAHATYEPELDVWVSDHDQHDIVNVNEDVSNVDDLLIHDRTTQPEMINDHIAIQSIRSSDQPRCSPPRQKLTKTQRTNRRHRANRYKYEVIRPIYARFTITDIKRILTDMNIYWVNINTVRQTLYIGLKNDTIRQQVENLLHTDMFTEEHYQRLRQKRRQRYSHHTSTRH